MTPDQITLEHARLLDQLDRARALASILHMPGSPAYHDAIAADQRTLTDFETTHGLTSSQLPF
ncbi:hypothetical protein FAES_3290 [Fibrella aestuarina BUZ 2]|uniref:Uncharacterized protein n=1 Tax=Fibrella aestuarina BUZ 2 TaxID=1166018 RepID=I0KAZ5_9BACT|nr:hypothetical protein [Fibrella aestuarina]CCH01298.1 hypothetical protein FAES_3290 [Fibrella aestuarina BUZ 2]